jgi:hypothetical protein
MNLTRVSIGMYQVSKHSSALYCKAALVVFFFPLCLSLSRCASRGQNDHHMMRAKLGAKPFYSCHHHWTKMDKICIASALYAHDTASQQG